MITLHSNNQNHHSLLQSIAHRAMLERGLLPDFSAAALAELGKLQSPSMKEGAPVGMEHRIRDMRDLLWASIDNDDSFDLDQLTVAEATPADNVKILVAIADVDVAIKKDSALDGSRDLPDAARSNFDRYHILEFQRGASCLNCRNGDRYGRISSGFRYLPRLGAQSCQACL